MASWIAAAEVPEFREAFSAAMVRTPTREANPFSRCFSSPARLAGTLLAMALIVLVTLAAWIWVRRGPGQWRPRSRRRCGRNTGNLPSRE